MDQRRTTHPALAEEESVKPFSITQALTSAMGAVLFGSEEASSSRVEPGAPGVLSAAHVSRGLKGAETVTDVADLRGARALIGAQALLRSR
jgi:hypothetical protein